MVFVMHSTNTFNTGSKIGLDLFCSVGKRNVYS